jgi:hypothetical protein
MEPSLRLSAGACPFCNGLKSVIKNLTSQWLLARMVNDEWKTTEFLTFNAEITFFPNHSKGLNFTG